MLGSLRKLTPVFCLIAGIAAGSNVACDSRPTTTTTAAPAACPECECKCSCPDGGSTSAVPGDAASNRAELEDLSYGLARKVARKDATCLADLDRIAKLDPKAASRMGMTRGQCLMIAGQCKAGSALMRKEWAETGQLMDEQLDRTVEQFESMYCVGPLDDRGELLRALTELQKGAHQGNIGIRACTNATKTIARLKGRVRPRNDEDFQILTIADSFGMTSANCFARAGDCAAAWKSFNDGLSTHIQSISDPKIRADVVRQTFDASVPKCKGRQ